MANPLLSNLVVGTTTYEIKDAWARTKINDLGDALYYAGTLAGGSTGTYGALTPAADKGAYYKVSTAGKIDGVVVEVGDVLICNTDGTAAATSSNYSTIAANWDFIQVNIPNLGSFATANYAKGAYTVPTITSPTGNNNSSVLTGGSVALSTTATAATGDATITISGTSGEVAAQTSTPSITFTQTATGANFTPAGDISSSTTVVTGVSGGTGTTSYLGATSALGTKSTDVAIKSLGTPTTSSAVTSVSASGTANVVKGINAFTTTTVVTGISAPTANLAAANFGTTSFLKAVSASATVAVIGGITTSGGTALTSASLSGSYVTASETLTLNVSTGGSTFLKTASGTGSDYAIKTLNTSSTGTAFSSVSSSTPFTAVTSATASGTVNAYTGGGGSSGSQTVVTGITSTSTDGFVTGYPTPTTIAAVTNYGNPSVTLATYTATASGRIAYISAVTAASGTTGTISATFTGKPYKVTNGSVTVPKHSHSFAGTAIVRATFSGTTGTHTHNITVGTETKNATFTPSATA